MRGLEPPGESLKRALEWIAAQRQDNPELKTGQLVERAAKQFDLSPAEADWLWRTLIEPKP